MATDQASAIPGTFNARELGGLRGDGGTIRRSVLFRSDAPVELGEDGQRFVQELGLRTAVDLREPVERQQNPADLEQTMAEVVSRPILGDVAAHADSTLEDVYMSLIDERGSALAAAVAAVQPPTLIFCSAGKDRTGLVTALVLGAVGVEDAEIVADYHRTESNMHGRFRERLQRHALATGLDEQQLAVKLGAPTALMETVLGRWREEYGGAAGYLRAHGLSDAQLTALRDALLEPDAG
jgi:protein-tyrosine phosphatase